MLKSWRLSRRAWIRLLVSHPGKTRYDNLWRAPDLTLENSNWCSRSWAKCSRFWTRRREPWGKPEGAWNMREVGWSWAPCDSRHMTLAPELCGLCCSVQCLNVRSCWENVELGRAGGYGRQRPGPEGTELKELDVVARVFAVYSCQWIDRWIDLNRLE